MGQKGSKYARKHLLNNDETLKSNSVQPEPSTNGKLSDDSQVIWDILCEPYNFEKRFLDLSYEQQILMVVTLNDIIESQFRSPQKGAAAKFADLAEKHLEKIHFLTDSEIDTGNFEPLADDEKRVIRMDCYGKINQRPDHQLSHLYKFFKSPKQSVKARFSDYDLNNSPSWRVFRQFSSFRSIAFKVQCYLYKQHINPDALKVMTVNDYCDVIFNAFKPTDGNCAAHFIPHDKNVRTQLIKTFMRSCGKQFEEQLINNGNDPRCAASLCNAMRRFGHTDVNSLLVTETNFTARVLDDLHEAGYDISAFKIGDKIPPAFTNQLIDEDNGKLLLARDENGNVIDKSRLPTIEVHHKNAVQFAASNGYLAKANYPHNLLLVDALMHRSYYHLFDAVYKQNNMNNYYSRLNVNNPYMISILGFKEKDSIYFDFENTTAFKRREAEDKKYVVNYLQEMELRMQNEIDITEKYHIPYNSSAIQSSNRIINALSEKSEKTENMKRFAKWLSSQRNNKNDGR